MLQESQLRKLQKPNKDSKLNDETLQEGLEPQGLVISIVDILEEDQLKFEKDNLSTMH
jgi:hypothetical protein